MNTKAIVKRLEAFTRYASLEQRPRLECLTQRGTSSCDVADALLKLKVPHGGFLAGLTMWSPQRQEGPTRIVGPAYTVKYVRKNYENEPKPAGHYVQALRKFMKVGSLTWPPDRQRAQRLRGLHFGSASNDQRVLWRSDEQSGQVSRGCGDGN